MQEEKSQKQQKLEEQGKWLKLNLHEWRNWSVQIEEFATRISCGLISSIW